MVLGIRSIGTLLVLGVGQKNRGIMPQFLQAHHQQCPGLIEFKPSTRGCGQNGAPASVRRLLGLGARMGRVIHLRQVLEIECRIDLGRGDAGVAEQFLHGAQVTLVMSAAVPLEQAS